MTDRWIVEVARGKTWDIWYSYNWNVPYSARRKRAPRLCLEVAMQTVRHLRTNYPQKAFRIRHTSQRHVLLADVL